MPILFHLPENLQITHSAIHDINRTWPCLSNVFDNILKRGSIGMGIRYKFSLFVYVLVDLMVCLYITEYSPNTQN